MTKIIRGILKQSIRFILNYKKLRLENGKTIARFRNWDYEIRREGAFVARVGIECSPLVSIVIRNHDRPDFLRDSLQCLRNQTYKNIEIILVEDRSVTGKEVADDTAI